MGMTMDKKILLNVGFCKGCGICVAMCPKSVLGINEENKVEVLKEEDCIACRQCEFHCPDFAIRIGDNNG